MANIGKGCDCDAIIVIILLAVLLVLLVLSLLGAVEILIEEFLMFKASSLSLSIIGQRVPLVLNKCSLMVVEILEANVLSDRSVSSMDMEQIDSSIVLGIFWTSAMCSDVVARL